MNKILVIAPHADDEVLGCGGTIAKLSKAGSECYVAIMTNAHLGYPEVCSQEQVDKVRAEAKLAHQILGVKDTIFFEFPAPRLDTFPAYKIAQAISDLIMQLEPDTLFIPGLGDLHVDHAVLYRASLVAARPINNCSVKKILVYETLSETNWAPMQGAQSFIPNVFMDISFSIENKLEAMRCFKSQLKEYPHCRSLKSIEALAAFRGSSISVHFAEAFMVERMIY